MSYQPCQNPNCKSYGKPHPNCHCEVAMAEGGEVAPDFIPDDEAPKTEEAPDFIPDDKAPSEAPDFIPDEPESNENLSPADLQAKMVEAANPNGPSKYETPGQQLAGAAEGLAQGFAPIGATLAETKLLGIPAEDIAGRQEANPWEHGIAEGIGAALGPAKAVKAMKIGSKLIQGVIANGTVAAGDEVSRWILGNGDPSDGVGAALARTSASALLGGLFNKAGGAVESKIEKMAESQLGQRLEYFLYGLAAAANKNTSELPEAAPKAASIGYKAGQKAFEAMTGKLLPATLGAGAEGYRGFKEDGLEGAMRGAAKGTVHGIIAGLAGKGIAGVSAKVVGPTLLKILSNGNISNMTGAFDHAMDMAAGSEAMSHVVNGLVNSGSFGSQQAISSYGSPAIRQKFKDYLDNGGPDQDIKEESAPQSEESQNFAQGGKVQEREQGEQNALATHYPEQNIIMHTAKGRILNYLNGLRPATNNPKLAFDDEPDTREKKRSYDKAIDIAATPLGVLEEVRKGTLEPEHVAHFNALHPEVGGLLQKKLAEHISRAQLEGKKPSYKVRQGLSLLMGTPLSGEMTPVNIQAAQNVFARANAQKAPNQQQPKTTKNTSTLSKADDAFLTGSQAREKRDQRA